MYPLKYERNGLKPQYIIEKISELTKGEAIICTEVGQNQMWTVASRKNAAVKILRKKLKKLKEEINGGINVV
jgi:thiamine pyrophosphate-dependent acetolactate synthase large subunit-like protein